jgi:hypothetical protein
MKPTIGRIVHYTLTESDAKDINGRRRDAGAFITSLGGDGPINPGERGRSGHIVHIGNSACTRR